MNDILPSSGCTIKENKKTLGVVLKNEFLNDNVSFRQSQVKSKHIKLRSNDFISK